jgi:hypothetical protein
MTQVTNTEFKLQTTALFPTNGIGAISAADIRTQMNNIADSMPFKNTGNIVAPGVTDDGVNTGGNGIFEIGDIWIDETGDVGYICLDNTTGTAIWSDLASVGGSVSVTGTPVTGQIGIWTNASTQEGDANITWNGTILNVTGSIIVQSQIGTISASRALILTDSNNIVEVNTSGGAVVISIPLNSSVAFPIGTVINFSLINATSTATITGVSGVTLNGVSGGSGNFLSTAYNTVIIYKRGINDWVANGNIATVA